MKFKKMNYKTYLKWFMGITYIALLFCGYFSYNLYANKAAEAKLLEDKQLVFKEQQTKEYLEWMYKNSNESKKTLQEIYSKVEDDKLRDILLSMIAVESSFNPKAHSPMNAICLMQVRYSVWEPELKRNKIIAEYRDLWDVSSCVDAGKYIFLQYLKKSNGNIRQALSKYVGTELGTKDSEQYTGRILANLGELLLLNYE